ncbi:hypothetical protein M885DRAFT_577098 [Pelagophyceae sp. CCMP2097]|nr:hypothetical protein M885DRAFT_577098 [Pelagophyceae sp. CCMP2097]
MSSMLPDEASSRKDAQDRLRGLLGRTLRFTLSDGRVVIGGFQCMDHARNFIASNATETRKFEVTKGASAVFGTEPRFLNRVLGLVLVPGKHLVRVDCLERDLDRPAPSTFGA